jgi:RimJ/RimL family protein N-acetyltransferase
MTVLPESARLDSVNLHRMLPTDRTVSFIQTLVEGLDIDKGLSRYPSVSTTIQAYKEIDDSAIKERLTNKYSKDNPNSIGYIVLSGVEQPIGMVFIGQAGVRWQPESDTVRENHYSKEEGITFFQWYLEEYRKKGIGKEVSFWLLGVLKSLFSEEGMWHQKKLWTAIREDDPASTHLIERLNVFERVGRIEEANKPAFGIWVPTNLL